MSAKTKAIQLRVRRQANRPCKGTALQRASARLAKALKGAAESARRFGVALQETTAVFEGISDTLAPEIRLVGCPKCGAVGDDPCRKPNGRKADQRHAVRAS